MTELPPSPTDGVEVQVPAGMLTAADLHLLADLAHTHAGHVLHLTGHGQLRLRGDRDRLGAAVAAAGLSVHDRVSRRILASPLSGRVGGLCDIRPVARALVAAVAAAPGAGTGLVVGVDDGRGDVAALAPDRAVRALPGGEFAVLRHGRDTGVRTTADRAVTVLLDPAACAAAPGGGEPVPPAPPPPVGWLDQRDGAVTLAGALPGGVLPARTAEFFAAVDHPLVLTPWRSVLLCDLDEWVADQVVRVLAPLGVVFDAQSPLLD